MTEEAFRRRVAANEALLREANEAIERGVWRDEEHRVVRFRCECAQVECNQAVELTLTDYERVRANGRRFVIAPGHERPEVERVVEQHGAHMVVEKLGEGGSVAEATDPRD